MTDAHDSPLCPKGFWTTVEDAARYLGITQQVMKKYKKACPANIHFEHGSRVGAPMPYKKFQFVFVSPEGTSASQNYCRITLLYWCRMCDYFSNNMNTTDDGDGHLFRYFKEYTNKEATPANISAAFEKGLLKQPSQLRSAIPLRVVTPPKKTSANTKAKKNNTTQSTTNNTTQSTTNNNCQGQNEDNSATVDDLIPSEERLTLVLRNRLKHLREDDVPSDKHLSKIGGLMKLAEIDILQFKADRHNSDKKREAKMAFSLCERCERNIISEAKKNRSNFCRKCRKKIHMEQKREQKRQDNAEMRVAPDSKVPITSLQPDEITIRMQKLNQERARKEKERKRLVAKLAAYEIGKEQMSKEMLAMAGKSLEYAKEHPTLLRNELARALYELIEQQNNSIDGSKPLSYDDVGPLVEMLADEINNQCRVWNEQDKQCQYSSKLLGVAMSLYLRSGRNAYEQFREDSIVRYPSADYLAKMKQKQKITDGSCITMYEDQLKIRGDTKEEVGQLIVDEMKLRKDVIMNVSSNDIIGVTNDFISTKKIVKSLLDTDSDDIEGYNETATYVNQWRYRSITGRTYNCEFFYNNGTLRNADFCVKIPSFLSFVSVKIPGFLSSASVKIPGFLSFASVKIPGFFVRYFALCTKLLSRTS